MDWSPALTMYASTPGQKDWRGINNLINSDRLGRMNMFEHGAAQFGGAQENFGGNIQGAMGQIGGVLAGNQQAEQQRMMMQYQADQAKADRDDKGNKFSMLFKALIGDPNQTVSRGNDAQGNNVTGMALSPLLAALTQAIGQVPGQTMSGQVSTGMGQMLRNPWM